MLFCEGTCFSTATHNVSGQEIVATDMNAHILCQSASNNNSPIRQKTIKRQFLKAQMPVKLIRLTPWLEIYSDKKKAYMIFEGFKVGFNIPPFLCPGCSWANNSKSVSLNKDIV